MFSLTATEQAGNMGDRFRSTGRPLHLLHGTSIFNRRGSVRLAWEVLAVFTLLGTAASTAHAGTFSDTLTNGINPARWMVQQTTSNMYSVTANSIGVTF